MACCTSTDIDSLFMKLKKQGKDHNLLFLKHSPNLELLVNQFNNATPEKSNDPEKISSCKYYDMDEMHKIKMPHKNKSLSLIHNKCMFF